MDMDGCGWMMRSMDGWVNGWIWMGELMDEWMDGYGWMNDGWMDSEWMDAWTGGWMAGSSQWQVFLPHFPNFSCLDFFRQPPGQTPGHVTLAAWYHSSV